MTNTVSSSCATIYGGNISSNPIATISGKSVTISKTGGTLTSYNIGNFTQCGVSINTTTAGALFANSNETVTISFSRPVNDIVIYLFNMNCAEVLNISTNATSTSIPFTSGNCSYTLGTTLYTNSAADSNAIAIKVRGTTPFTTITLSSNCRTCAGGVCGAFAWGIGLCNAVAY